MATTSQGADSPAMKSETPPVEMSTLQSPPSATEQTQSLPPPQQDQEPDTTAGASQSQPEPPPSPSSARIASAAPALTRQQTEALGPATESPIPPPPTDRGPTLTITLMLTTGARHPYKIDERYLKNRKVEFSGSDGAFDPREISGYKLKELIWTDWRNEWEPRPASPSSIRLIILGRLLDDKAALREFPFKLDDTNVVHMTVKPADFLDDDDAAAKGTVDELDFTEDEFGVLHYLAWRALDRIGLGPRGWREGFGPRGWREGER